MLPDTFVTFSLDPRDPSWRRGWDPLVDLADPTRDHWWFSQHGGLVRVRIRGLLDKGWVEGSCPVEEFEQVVDVCVADALRLLFWEQPALRENTYLQTLEGRPARG